MDPREFAAAQNRETRKITATVRRAVVREGVPVTVAEREALAKKLLPQVKRARVRVRDLGVEFMETQADAADAALEPQPIREYKSGAIVKVLERVTGVADEKSGERRKVSVTMADPKTRADVRKRVTVTDANRNDPVVKKVIADRAAASVERHVRNAAREAVSDAAEVAGTEIGWARVLSGEESCAFCAMLASRGPVYGSEESAGAVTERSGRYDSREAKGYHDHCDCIVVPVFEGVPWYGQEHFELLEDLWIESTKGLSAPDSTKAFTEALKKTHLTKLPATNDDPDFEDSSDTFDPAPDDDELEPTPEPSDRAATRRAPEDMSTVDGPARLYIERNSLRKQGGVGTAELTEVNERIDALGLSAAQARRAEMVARNEATLIELAPTPEERDALVARSHEGLQLFAADKDVAINVPGEDVLAKILDDGRLRSQRDPMVTETGGGGYVPAERELHENAWFGDHDEPPIYGYLRDRSGKESGADDYGDIALVLSPAMRDSSTVVVGDSLDSRLLTFPGRLDKPGRYTGNPSEAADHETAQDYADYLNGVGVTPDPDDIWAYGGFYADMHVEAQIHHGVTVGDIEFIHFKGDPPSESMIARLRSAGIRFTVQGEL